MDALRLGTRVHQTIEDAFVEANAMTPEELETTIIENRFPLKQGMEIFSTAFNINLAKIEARILAQIFGENGWVSLRWNEVFNAFHTHKLSDRARKYFYWKIYGQDKVEERFHYIFKVNFDDFELMEDPYYDDYECCDS